MTTQLPWHQGQFPLMLAPMQGLTNSTLRSLFIEWVQPDVVFTEFMRVNPVDAKQKLSGADLREIAANKGVVPLVVQLIGHGRDALVAAAESAQEAGAKHINLNMGCPYGRMTTGLTGGGMLRNPEELNNIIPALRRAITGTFSIKLRSGYDNPGQIFDLLPLFEASSVDFLILHTRIVTQKYSGVADHNITAQVVQKTRIPVIANGDITNAAYGLHVQQLTGAAGLMLGRGAISDPLIFQRLRGKAPAKPDHTERAAMLRHYLGEILVRYSSLFCGDAQILARMKEIISTIDDTGFEKSFKTMKKSGWVAAFSDALKELG